MDENRDKIFSDNKDIYSFKFTEEVADVFDDMLHRSIPFYEELQSFVSDLVRKFSIKNTNIYDLGCSTGTTMLNILKSKESKNNKIIGMDNSRPMLNLAKKKIYENYSGDNFELHFVDLNKNIKMKDASVVIMVLALQFIRPINREVLIKRIYKSLKKNGCFILVEKVISHNAILNKLFIDYYHEFKRSNGYSHLEISQKREALENILVPYSISENLELLNKCDFKDLDIFFKWYNFVGIIGVKK